MSRPARVVRLAMALAVTLSLIGPQRPSTTAAATDLLPDLRMWPLSEFRTELSGGERRLRFTTNMTNEGAGPLEVRGARSSTSEAHFRTRQAIRNDAGGTRLVDSRALMEYAEDGHDHWHVQGVMLYQMWSDDGQVRRGTKVGFCFLDSARMFDYAGPFIYGEPRCGRSGSTSNSMGLSRGYGDVYPWNFAYQWIDISTLAPGDYVVQARADEQNWYLESNEANNCAWARVRITSTNGPVQVLSSARTCQAPPSATALVERQYGNDRYETAAAASEDGFRPGVPAAFVVTGASFPDALTAGTAAGMLGGPVILVQKNFIPALALTELERLNPQRIYLIGSTGVISSYIEGLVARYHNGGGLQRIAGADRYATSAAISARFYAPGAPVAYVATGADWPDAVATVPHAARAGGPLLLTRATTIPDSVKAELTRLQPGRIVVVGGASAVSEAVLTQLEAYDTGGGVSRIAGADRFATAAMMSAQHMPDGAVLAYVATGENFPDALAAGPVAARQRGSVVLVRASSIPAPSSSELDRLNPHRVIIIGGPSVVNMAVQAALRQFTPG